VIALNPLAPIFDLAQKWVVDPHTPWPTDAALGGPGRLAVAVSLYLAICVLAVWVFSREAPRIAESL
jgi:hypothetical protein